MGYSVHWGIFIILILNIQQNRAITLATSSENATVGKPFTFICTVLNVKYAKFERLNKTRFDQVCTLDSECRTAPYCPTYYQYNCDGTEYKLTIPGSFITDMVHNQMWRCFDPLLSPPIYSRNISLFVNVPISNVTFTDNSHDNNHVAVIKDKTKTFSCTTNAGRPSSRIYWFLSSVNLTSEAIPLPDVCETDCKDGKVISSSNLSYTGNLSDDGSNLTCTALNIDGNTEKISASKTIIIWYPPIVAIEPDGQYDVIENKTNLVIHCHVTNARPNVTSYRWFKDDELISSNDTYSILTVNRIHTGRYTCKALNDAGTSTPSSVMMLNVLYGVQLKSYKKQRPIEGQSEFSVNCTGDSNPPLSANSIFWTKRNNNKFKQQGQILLLYNVTRNDSGIYICNATIQMTPTDGNAINVTGTSTVEVDVVFGPQRAVITPAQQQLIVNESGSIGPINCTAECNPECTMEWSGPNLPESITSVLNILIIDRNQAGTYTCKATNKASDETSHITVNVSVNYGPKHVNISEPDTAFTINENVTFGPIYCAADCHPECTIIWNGTNIPDRVSSELKITNINRSQEGIFQCIAYNIINITSKSISITVNYGPVKVDTSAGFHSLTVNETDTIDPIYCLSDCQPNCTMTWSGPNLPADISSVLVLRNINKNQTGLYKCSASNIITNMTSDPFQITVNYMPLIYEFSGNKTVNENDSTFIQCKYESVPNSEVTWKFNNILLNNSKDYTETNHSLHFSTLSLNKIECQSMGTYICEANNMLGLDSQAIDVDVYCSPRLLYTDDEITIRDDEPINITATIVAFPAPSIRWTFLNNESEVNLSKEIVNHSVNKNRHVSCLTIFNVTDTDFGYYQLYADNNIGTIDGFLHSYHVIPAGKPNQPENVSCNEQNDGVVVNWKPGYDGGDPQVFRVHYRSLENKNFIEQQQNYTQNYKPYMSALIRSLKPDTGYVFQVSTHNTYGSRVSEIVNCNTSISAAATANQTNNLTAVGIGTGVGVAIIFIVIIVFLYIWRRKINGLKDGLKDNILYESAGQDFKINDNTGTSDYAVVQKTKRIKSCTAEKHQETSLYAVVQKHTQLTGGKKNKEYEQQTGSCHKTYSSENKPDMGNNKNDKLTKTNKDGLVYADLVFNDNSKGRKFIIHGSDSKTSYADIDLNLKADPEFINESSKEDTNEVKNDSTSNPN